MNIELIRKLAAAPPPPSSKRWRFKDHRTATQEIARLSSQLGLPPGKKTLTLGNANEKILELEQLLAAKAPPAPASAIAPLEKFLSLPCAERELFSRCGGLLDVNTFNSLPLEMRISHHNFGGRLEAGVDAEDAPKLFAKDGRYKKTMRLKAFNSLGLKDRSALIRHGVLITK
jgi:hypothetical protein